MRLRTIIAALGAAAVIALGLSAPQAGASTTARATVGPYSFIWYPSTGSCGIGLNCVGIQQGLGVSYYVNGNQPNSIDIGGNGSGYQELINTTNGKCLGWDDTHVEIVAQTCTGASWQLWAGTGTIPDLIWNKWYDTTYHTLCPIPGGYTQSVITAHAQGAMLLLQCPLDNGFTVYDNIQKWELET